MRLNQLDLTRYGGFTDYSLSFGERPSKGPDLHIVYGPNEAGKSTSLTAFLDLIFGIETRSQYNFLHPYTTMRIGGEIEINGALRQFARIKRAQNSLLDEGDKPIADGIILGDLGGIDRTSYTTMFSLDDDSLEAGGNNILASEGDLGQLLFSASAGLSDLSQKLAEIREQADSFYKYRARSGELADLKNRLGELKQSRDEIDTIASEYSRLADERDRASDKYNSTMVERGRIQSKLDELKRQLGALPRRIVLSELREKIKPLTDIPTAPIGWMEELPELQKAEIELSTREKGIDEQITKLSEELDEIVADNRALDIAERIDQLIDLRARYLTADKDIPERELQRRDTELAIAGLLARMECDRDTDPSTLLLGATIIGSLQELMERRSGVDSEKATAEEELNEARDRLADAQSKLEVAGGQSWSEVNNITSQLVSALSVARANDHEARLSLAEREQNEQIGMLAERMGALLPWADDAHTLPDVYVPDVDDIEAWRSSIVAAEKSIDRHDLEIERLLANKRKLGGQIQASGQASGILTDKASAEVRVEREDAWANHKRILDAESAAVFEASLRRDDIVSSSRISNATEVAQLTQIGKDLSIVDADLEAEREGRNEAAQELEDVKKQLANTIGEVSPSLPQDWNLSKLEAWLGKREQALESFFAAEKAGRDVIEAEKDRTTIQRKLMDVASAVGLTFAKDASIETLLSIMQTAIDSDAESRAAKSELDTREGDVKARERKMQKANKIDQDWNDSWNQLCAECWLRKDGSTPTVPSVREILKALNELSPLIDKKTSLADRIEKMKGDQSRFAAEASALAKALDLNSNSEPLELMSQVSGALETARSAKKAKEDASSHLKDAKTKKTDILEKKKIQDLRKAEMSGHFNVESLDEVGLKLRNLDTKAELEKQFAATKQEIIIALGVPTIDEAEIILDKMDRNAVDAEIAELEGRFLDHDKRSQELFSDRSKASDRLEAVGGDNAAAMIETRRRTTLLEIEEGAERYLRLRLGVAASEHALRIYRDKHRSSMMARASDAFQTISRGAYEGLATQPNKDSELLVAVGATGGSKIASELSKGTRFQLYLALRVAGYFEFVQSRRPVPFIADDIMETFDDFRAEEAFKLFAQMGEVGQVIYFTHHQHLCEIAQKACPSVQIHNLPERMP